ncbi:hypothetical protein [Streptomyces pratensis]
MPSTVYETWNSRRHRGAVLSRGTDTGPAIPELVAAAGRLPDATAIDCVM